VGSAKELTWDYCPPAAEERLLLARLLLAQRQYQRAALAAQVFDLPGPMAFMAHVPASLHGVRRALRPHVRVHAARDAEGRRQCEPAPDS